MNAEIESGSARTHRGPSLLALAIVYVVLFVASLAVSTALAHGAHFPSVFSARNESAHFFAANPFAVQVMALLQFGAAIPFGIFVATATSRVQFLGRKVAGIHIALFGGVAAAVALLFSACAEWVLAQPDVASDASLTRVLHLFCFALGGPGFVVPFGLFVAGISVVAGLQDFAPRWLMRAGLVIALVAELSTLTLLLPAAAYLLPIARFAGFLWMIAIALRLPKEKRRVAT